MPTALYKCNKCKRIFENHSEAKCCEEQHLKPLLVTTKNYSLTPYPFSVEISFPNGEKKIYISDDLMG